MDELDKALQYVGDNIDMVDIEYAVYQADKYHCMPSNVSNVGEKVADLLEEYGDDNELPEGWWEEYGEIDDIIFKLYEKWQNQT